MLILCRPSYTIKLQDHPHKNEGGLTMKKRIALLALALTLCGTFAAFPVSAHEAETGTESESAVTESIRSEGTGTDCLLSKSLLDRPNKVNADLAGRGRTLANVSGVNVLTTIQKSNISAPNALYWSREESAAPVLCDRYHTEEMKPMTLKVPAFSAEPRTFVIDLGNENVTSLLGSNFLSRSSLTVAPGSTFCVFNSISDNGFDTIATGS